MSMYAMKLEPPKDLGSIVILALFTKKTLLIIALSIESIGTNSSKHYPLTSMCLHKIFFITLQAP